MIWLKLAKVLTLVTDFQITHIFIVQMCILKILT